MIVNETEEEGNKEVRAFLEMDRKREEKAKKIRLGWCSCCGYGDCKRATTPAAAPLPPPPPPYRGKCDTCGRDEPVKQRGYANIRGHVFRPILCESCWSAYLHSAF
jgi:hypothetical protein